MNEPKEYGAVLGTAVMGSSAHAELMHDAHVACAMFGNAALRQGERMVFADVRGSIPAIHPVLRIRTQEVGWFAQTTPIGDTE